MANGKFEGSIKILKDRNGEENHDIFHDEVCMICNNILINPCNGLCGCKYCWDCIENYLKKEEKCCPGQSDDCKSQILNIDNNILLDQSMNSRISRVIVKYPEQSSQFSEELRKLQDRILSSKWSPNKCPFSGIGCRNNKPIDEDIDEHLTNQNLSHSKLLMECIDNLKSELKSIKSEITNSKKENKKLRKEMEIMKRDAEIKQALISELQYNDKMKTQQIECLLQKLHQTESESDDTEYTQVDDKSDISSMIMPPMKVSNDVHRSINIIHNQILNIDNQLRKIETNVEKVNYGEFLWAIDNFSQKINEARKAINTEIYSDPFYTHKNGYKMCLRVDPIGISFGKGSHLAIYFCMMQGPFDNILSWPMKFDVTFALINQETGYVHTSRTARFDDHPDNFAWNKPTTGKKIGYGYHKFIEMDELLNNQSLFQGDQIFVKCTVHMTP